jgi:hypothetical protein
MAVPQGKAVYERQKSVFAGSFSSDLSAMSVAGSAQLKLGIVQNVQLSFAQQIARIYDVSNGGVATGAAGGAVPVFYVGGRTQGQGTIARVIGPQSGALCDFYSAIGNVCQPQDLTFTFRGGCAPSAGGVGTDKSDVKTLANSTAAGLSNAESVGYTVVAAVMTNLGITVGSQDMIVNENITLMFANLTCDPTAV